MANPIDQVIELYLPAARAGDRQAFARLVAATQNTVTSIALAITRDVGHSEDIAQEAYLKVWSRLGSLRQPNSFMPWLRQITRNLARDHLRKLKVRPGDEPGADVNADLSEQVPATQPDGEAALLEAEQTAMIRRALDALPDDSREVLTLAPAYSWPSLLRQRQAPYLQRFTRSLILTVAKATLPVRSVAKPHSYGT